MNTGYISIADVLQLLRLGRKAEITLCSYDKNRETGGERLTYRDVTLCEPAGPKAKVSAMFSPTPERDRVTKNPHHRFNKTINIQTVSGDVITVHPVLMEVFNGQRVVL